MPTDIDRSSPTLFRSSRGSPDMDDRSLSQVFVSVVVVGNTGKEERWR